MIRERASFVGSTQLINGLCSKICLWSFVKDGEADRYNNKLTEERGSQDRPTGFPFPPLDTRPPPPHTLGLLSVLETQARVFNILAVSISILLL